MISSDANDPNGDAPVTTDGSCGPKNGGTICGDFPAGGVRNWDWLLLRQ